MGSLQRSCSLVFLMSTPVAMAAPVPQETTREVVTTTSAVTDEKDPALQRIAEFIATIEVDRKNPRWKTTLPKPPKLSFSKDHDYFWHQKTSKGDIKIKLMPDVAPMHVSSTIFLVQLGFFDNLKFHRVINRFMAQGGCPLGTGTGGPGYKYGGEYSRDVKHDRPGLLSMANAGQGTDGSQFFLTFVPTPWLDGKHTLFGEVVEGMEVLKALERCGSRTGATSEELLIKKCTISVAPKKKGGKSAGEDQ